MAGVIGSVRPFDESIEQRSLYIECFGYFVAANGISDEKIVATFFFKSDAPIDFQLAAQFTIAYKDRQ